VAYGYLAYQTAYLKAHYPTHFWAAVLSNELNNTAKVVKYINEARGQGIEIQPPDVNVSFDNFTPSGKTIRFGLAAIKGIGQSAVSSIVEARSSGGAFRSLFDFTERVDSKAVNKRVLESLIKSGAFDTINQHRAQMFAVIDAAMESGQRSQKSRASGQVDLFGALAATMSIADPPLPRVDAWSPTELLKGEKETLGFYISGHPLMRFDQALADFANADVDRLSSFHHGAIVTVGGIVMEMNMKMTKKGDRFALFQLEDQYGSIKVVAWPEPYSKAASLLKNDAAVLLKGRLEIDDGGTMTIIAEEVQSLENIRERAARTVIIRFSVEAITGDRLETLHHLLDSHRGECTVLFEVALNDGQIARIQPNQFVRVKVTPELTDAITKTLPEARVELAGQRASSAAH
jgi:DNA polymerase-3 subunit alpha